MPRDPATGARLLAQAARIAQPRTVMPQRARIARIAVPIFLLSAPAGAHETRQLTAVRVGPGVTPVDGSLDDPGRAGVAFTAGFLQMRPVDGAAPSRPTEVAVACDDTAVIVGVRLTQRPETIRAGLTRRDAVSLDTYGDHRTAYTFGVTAGDAPEEAPTTAAILGGGRLLGRTLSGLSAGALVAVSDRTEAAGHTPLAPLIAFGIAGPAASSRPHWTEADARGVLAEWERSGKTLEAFARSRGLVSQRLAWWNAASGIARGYARTTRQEAGRPRSSRPMGRTPCIAGTATVMKLSTRRGFTW